MQSLWAAGFYYITPAFMTLLTNTSVLWVTGFSLLFFAEERPLMRSPRFWLGLGLSLTGLLGVLYFKEDFTAVGTRIGIVIALAEAFMWGVYAVSVKIALRDIDSRSGFSVISLYTTVGLWICAAFLGHPGQALHLELPGLDRRRGLGHHLHRPGPRPFLRGDSADRARRFPCWWSSRSP